MGPTATLTDTIISTTRSARNSRLRPYLWIALVAVLAWGAAFLAPGSRYWDDWVINRDILQSAQEVGLPWTGYVLVALCAIGIGAFKVVALGATLVVGWTTYEISGRGLGLRSSERLLLAILVVALPLNAARMIAVLDIYTMSMALFFLAWYLLVSKSPTLPGRARYVAAALLLLVSYSTGSLLLFTVLPIAHLAHLAMRRDVPWWQAAPRFVARFWYVLMAPVLFWAARMVFFQPYGLYNDYNKPALTGGLTKPTTVYALGLSGALALVCVVYLFWLITARTAHSQLWQRLSQGVLTLGAGAIGYFLLIHRVSATATALVVPATLLLCAAALLVSTVLPAPRRNRTGAGLPLESGDAEVTPVLAAGLVALILAMLPYLLVGKLPTFGQWDSRHQLLMPLGVAIIIVATVRALSGIFPLPLVRLVALGLVTVSVLASMTVSLKLLADWRKQAQVIQALSQAPLVRKAGIVVFSDQGTALNYEGRQLNFYEYTGWLNEAFGNQSRLGIDQTGVQPFLDGGMHRDLAAPSRYGFAGYTGPTHAVAVAIIPLQGASWLTLLAGEPAVRLQVTPIASLAKMAARG